MKRFRCALQLLTYCIIMTTFVLAPSRAIAELGELTYHQPVVLPSFNLNHLKLSGLPDLLFTIIGRLLCANPTACENALAGTPPSEWAITEPGDTTILGFATEQSVNAGETVVFKIRTPAIAYHIDIFRAGWYQGNGARRVATNVRPSASMPQSQPDCIVDTANKTGLIDCGNWAPSASWTVPRNAPSGVYFARLVRDDTGGSSYVLFVVRNDASRSAIVYQTSDTTRAAYNSFGGNSLYQCTVHCPPGNPLLYKAAYKVSFNRPNTAVTGGMQHSSSAPSSCWCSFSKPTVTT
ncbi:MAG: N,N-dimethylformamidase beta subunit family domain-containing protein [Betaproteobacteria bacterium]